MYKKALFYIMTGVIMMMPLTTWALDIQASSDKKDLKYVINLIISYLNQALVLLMGLAVIIFVWYVIQYFIRPNEDRTNASSYVMYSLIGFFVILSFWGLVSILQNTFGLQNESNQPSSWTSFKAIFPESLSGGSSGSSGGFNVRPRSSGGFNTSPGSSGGFNTSGAI